MVKAKRPNIKDVAQAARVSTASVSYALSGKGRISEKTRKRILSVASRMGFLPSLIAARLRTGRSRLLGAIIQDIANPFFSELTDDFQKVALQHDYMTIVASSGDDAQVQESLVTALLTQGIDGLMLAPAQDTSTELIERIAAHGVPLVSSVRQLDFPGIEFVGPDNRRAGSIVGTHLCEQGYRYICWLGGERTTRTFRNRLDGLRAAIGKQGIKIPANQIYACGRVLHVCEQEMGKLLKRHPKCDAVVCYSDHTALAAYAALAKHGKQAGRDFGVVGFDNIPQSASMYPPLTTVENYPRTIGKRCAATLIDRLAGQTARIQQTLIEPEFIVRESTRSQRGRARRKRRAS